MIDPEITERQMRKIREERRRAGMEDDEVQAKKIYERIKGRYAMELNLLRELISKRINHEDYKERR